MSGNNWRNEVMKKMIFILSIILCVVMFLTPAHAITKKLAQTGMQFLKVDVSTRAAAMGGSYIMVGNDASAIFYNPAGIAKMEKPFGLFLSQTQWIAGIKYSAVAVAKTLPRGIATIGLSVLYSDYGDDIIGTRVATTTLGYEETGFLDGGAYAIGLSIARQITDKFTIGVQVKYCYQHLGSNILETGGQELTNKVGGMAYDIGTIFNPGFTNLRSLRFGMTIRNFSPQFKYRQEAFQLPLTFIVGTAIDVLDLMGEHKNPLLISVDAIHPRDYTERLHVGAEYTLLDMIALRGGYKFNYDEEGLTGGVGLMKKMGSVQIAVGYAYSDFGVFNSVNRISVNVGF
jgi:hypothetical protein